MEERSLMTLAAVTLDCADPLQLGAFYAEATGLALDGGSDGDFAGLCCASGLFLGFQRVNGYQRPRWPGQEQAQQAHLDFEVDDLDQAEAALLLRGATKPDVQPSGRWRVLTDPAGHPFCLTTTRTVRSSRPSPATAASATCRRGIGYRAAVAALQSRPTSGVTAQRRRPTWIRARVRLTWHAAAVLPRCRGDRQSEVD